MKKILVFLLLLAGLAQAQNVNYAPLASAVTGDTPRSQTKYITNPDLEVPSGFYSINGGVITGGTLPVDGSGINWWNILVIHHENATFTGDGWMSQEATPIGGGPKFVRWRAGNTSTWSSWQPINAPAPVVLSANYTFTNADSGKTFVVGTNTNLSLTVATGLVVGWWVNVDSNNSTGTHSIITSGTSVNGGTGSTANNGIKNKITGSFQRAVLQQTAGNWFSFSGNVTP